MGACFSTRSVLVSVPSRVAPETGLPNRENINVYEATAGQPLKVDVIYTDETRKKLSQKSKLQGNHHFSQKEYALAIEAYTKAIKIYDGDSVYFSNRGLCYAFLAKFDEALADAEKSIKLDPKNYKAYHIKGMTLVEIGNRQDSNEKIKEGLENLEKSLNIVKDQDDNNKVISQLEAKVHKANKIIYLRQRALVKQKEERTQQFVIDIISKAKELSAEEKNQKQELIKSFISQKQMQHPQEIPEALCCKIAFEMIKEPVLGPTGISYEKEMLLDHLRKIGKFDPSTRQPLTPESLVLNKQLLQAIKDFQVKNPWSFDFISHDEDYHAILLL